MIKIDLPLTTPSGKVRVKKRETISSPGIPVSIAESNNNAENIAENFYLEWQISYDTKDEEKSETKFSFERNGKEKYLYELSDYLVEAIKTKIINHEEFIELKKYVDSITSEDFIDKNFPINRIEERDIIIRDSNFSLLNERHPLLVYFSEKEDFCIEIKIDRKQRAVGFQPQVYLSIPLTSFENYKDLLERKARRNEMISLKITKEKNNFIIPSIKIFSIASSQHNKDILNILNSIENNL